LITHSKLGVLKLHVFLYGYVFLRCARLGCVCGMIIGVSHMVVMGNWEILVLLSFFWISHEWNMDFGVLIGYLKK